jgi:geranylgeranyl reductase family protein
VTAYHLAAAGASVLLLDRARFPRDKPCGGGVTLRAARLLPFPLDPVVEDRIDVVEMRLRGRACEHRCSSPIVLMTRRRRLDAFLVERAVEAGATFRDGARVSDPAALPAETIVGADGVNGVCARVLRLAGRTVFGVALEGRAPADDRYRGRILFELCVLRGGYAWVFPKADHLNVGVGGWEPEALKLRDALRAFARAHELGPLDGIHGYRLPVGDPAAPLARGRALLVGDAAGLVDPLSGDGIYEAFVSARLAAEAILDVLAGRAGSLEPYTTRVRGALGRTLSSSWAAKRVLDRFPRATFALASTPPLQRALERLARGDPQPRTISMLGKLARAAPLRRRLRRRPSGLARFAREPVC